MNRPARLVLVTLLASACAEPPAPPAAPPPPPVRVGLPVVRDVQVQQGFTGRTEAVSAVEVRARVSGFLETVHFQEGTEVEAGALLFTIEKDAYEAARKSAAAALASAKANAKRARADLERAEQAIGSNAISQQEYALRLAERDMADAAVLEAEAKLADAERNLGYCEVVAPIAGRVGRVLVDAGNLVGAPSATVLTELVQMDPIQVTFEVSEAEVLEYLSEHEYGDGTAARGELPLKLGLGTGDDHPFEGVVDFVDSGVDANTSTLLLRGVFPNGERKLLPGFYARLLLPGDLLEGAVLVEEAAIGTDLSGKYVLVVDDKGLAQLNRVELGPLEGRLRVILSGLEAGQRYITEGIRRARPGRPVTVLGDAADGATKGS